MIKMCSVGCKKVIFTRCVCSVAQLCPTLCDLMDYGPPDHCHGILQARILGVDCHSLLQGIFLTQRSNVGLLHCRWILYHPSHQGSPIFLPYFLLVKSLSHVQLFVTPWLQPTRLLSPWNFPGKSPGVGCHFLLQGIFLTQGLNPGLLHSRQTLYHLSLGSYCYYDAILHKQLSTFEKSSLLLLLLLNFRVPFLLPLVRNAFC